MALPLWWGLMAPWHLAAPGGRGARSIELLLALALTNPEIVMATARLNLFVGVDLAPRRL